MLQKIESFFSGNKVFFLGLLGAVGVVLQQFISSASIDWKVVGFAAVVAGLSYAAKNLTGTVASLLGILGSVVLTISTVASGGHVSWNQLILSTLAAVITVVTGSSTSTKTQS
jgi:hypothetical protein